MIKVDVHDNRNKLEAKSEYGQIEELKIEIRKHHVLPGCLLYTSPSPRDRG